MKQEARNEAKDQKGYPQAPFPAYLLTTTTGAVPLVDLLEPLVRLAHKPFAELRRLFLQERLPRMGQLIERQRPGYPGVDPGGIWHKLTFTMVKADP